MSDDSSDFDDVQTEKTEKDRDQAGVDEKDNFALPEGFFDDMMPIIMHHIMKIMVVKKLIIIKTGLYFVLLYHNTVEYG